MRVLGNSEALLRAKLLIFHQQREVEQWLSRRRKRTNRYMSSLEKTGGRWYAKVIRRRQRYIQPHTKPKNTDGASPVRVAQIFSCMTGMAGFSCTTSTVHRTGAKGRESMANKKARLRLLERTPGTYNVKSPTTIESGIPGLWKCTPIRR